MKLPLDLIKYILSFHHPKTEKIWRYISNEDFIMQSDYFSGMMDELKTSICQKDYIMMDCLQDAEDMSNLMWDELDEKGLLQTVRMLFESTYFKKRVFVMVSLGFLFFEDQVFSIYAIRSFQKMYLFLNCDSPPKRYSAIL